MGNKLSSEGNFQEYLLLATDDDVRRLKLIWGNREFMLMEDFITNVLKHPSIPRNIACYLYKKFCRGSAQLTLSNFILAVTILTKAPLPVREEFFFSSEYNYANLPELRSLDLLKLPRPNAIYSIHQVLSGVTHFNEKEISDLESLFSDICGSNLRKITRDIFRLHLDELLPVEVIDGVFNVFDENGDNVIKFKEFVCAFSALFNGPENARLTYIAQIWDTNRRGQLTSDNLRSMFDFFQVPEEQRVTLTLSDISNSSISILDFVCWLVQHEELSHRLILLSDEIGFFGFSRVKDRSTIWKMLCDIENRLTLKDVNRWWIVPTAWWRSFIISLQNGDIPVPDFAFLDTLLVDYSLDPYLNTYCIFLPNLVLGKDYHPVPSLVMDALDYTFNLFSGRAPLIERQVLLKKEFLPDGGWPDTWGHPEDFPGDHFLEIYRMIVQIFNHSPPSKDWIDPMDSILHSVNYSLMETLYFSRSAKLEVLRGLMAVTYDTTPDAIRFWTLEVDGKPSRTLIPDTVLTYHDLGAVSSLQILVERRNDDMSWPEELIKIQKIVYSHPSAIDSELLDIESTCISSIVQITPKFLRQRHATMQQAGLINMGNTCYMSAALQSVSNVTVLTDYVLRLYHRSCTSGSCPDNDHAVIDLSLSSDDRRLLASCEVFQEYAKVLYGLFEQKESVAPKSLWDVIVDKTLMFADRQQHDCQEFLQIFLDLLHIDLQKWNTNKREGTFTTKAPENIASVNDAVCASMDKENVLRILDVTSLKTDDCDVVLISDSEQRKVDEIVVTDNLVVCKSDDCSNNEESSNAQSDVEKADMIWLNHKRRENSLIFDLFNGQIRSSLRCLQCSDVSSTFDLFSCINLPIIYENFFFLAINVVRINDRIIRKYFFHVTPTVTMAEVKVMVANEVKLPVDRIAFLFMNGQDIMLHTCHDKPELHFAQQVAKMNFFVYAYEMEESIEQTHLIVAVNRLLSRSSVYSILAIDGLNVETFDAPFYVQLPKKKSVTARELYDFALSAVRKYSIGNHKHHNMSTYTEKRRKIGDDEDADTYGDDRVVGERSIPSITDIKSVAAVGEMSTLTRSNRAVDADEDTQLPFEISFAGDNPKWCATCHWSRFCCGCPIDTDATNLIQLYGHAVKDENSLVECSASTMDSLDDESSLVYLMKNRIMTFDWKPEVLHLKYNYDDERPTELDKTTFAACQNLALKRLSLDDCFNEFVKPETILDSRCDKCVMQTNRQKSLALWRLPKILVIHLKRFQYVPTLMQHVKQTKAVEFLLDDFDLSKYLSDEVKSNVGANAGEAGDYSSTMLYRCISIVNHLGDLNYGHYTSFIRRPDNQWFLFNDSDSKPVDIKTEDTTNAYLLFYERIGG